MFAQSRELIEDFENQVAGHVRIVSSAAIADM